MKSSPVAGHAKDVWVLIGHYKRKPSELMGVYAHYERGKQALDALGFIGAYHEVALTRITLIRDKEFKLKKVKK